MPRTAMPRNLLLVLLPLAAALAYAGGHALLGPRPSTADVVPALAVCTARFRGVDALDDHWPFDRPEQGRVSEAAAGLRNLPGLKGVDRSGPIHWVLLPRGGRADPTLMIFPVSDAGALRTRFEGRDLPEAEVRGLERHAQHLEIAGSFAGLAWDREAVRHLGEGGITCEDRGEDFALAIDVPAMAAYVLTDAGRAPWRAIAEALGAEPGNVTVSEKPDPKTGRHSLSFPWGRVPDVGRAWKTARLWAWKAKKEVVIELEPADPALQELLGQVAAVTKDDVLRPFPGGTLASLEVRGGAGRRALARALHLVGVKGVDGLLAKDTANGEAGDLMLWAFPNASEGHGWTVAVAGRCGPLPVLAPALDLPEVGVANPLPEGAAPVTLSDTAWAAGSPAGKAVRITLPAPAMTPCAGSTGSSTWDVLLLGADAELQAKGAWRWPLYTATPVDAGVRRLARLTLSRERARTLLGSAITEGGLLSVLAGGDLRGDITTDGRLLRLHLAVARKPE